MNTLSRTIPLLGEHGIRILKNASVAVFGLGGVGSFTAEALARSGIGTLYLTDGDKIDETNINRQLYALYSTIGTYKTEAAKKRIEDINPLCKTYLLTEFILPREDGSIGCFDSFDKIDFIVDAVDTVSLKIALAEEAEKRKIPIISAAGCGNRLDANSFIFADIFQTSGCPVCRILRHSLKKKGVKSLQMLYNPKPADTSCRPVASVSWTPAVAGLLIAQHVIRSLCKV